MKFYQTTLSNGLTILGEYRPAAVSAALAFFAKTGARDELPQEAGVSHFLEHMMFKGTAKRNALQLTFDLAAIGAQANAYTSEETTVFYASVLPEYLEPLAEILSDMLRPALDETDFNTEKKVILEEIALYQDRPTHVLFETALRRYFGNHPAGNSVLGSTESVSALTRDAMQDYFDRRYAASNVVVVVSGSFVWEEVVQYISKHCAHWPQGSMGRQVDPHLPDVGEEIIKRENLQMAHVCLLAPAPSAQHEARYASAVLASILGDVSGSHTYWELIDKGLADIASVDVDEMDGTGVLYSYVSATPDRIENVESIMRDILSKPLNFDADWLERCKTRIASRLVLSGESSMRRCMAVGNNWVYRKEYRSLAEELSAVKLVTKDKIEKLVEEYNFTPVWKVGLVPS